MSVLQRFRARMGPWRPSEIRTTQVLLACILLLAVFTRFWRLGTPDQCYFDEVYFPTTGAEILRGDDQAWEFYGHENTHPPLSKLIMAVGQGVFGRGSGGEDNHCWNDQNTKYRSTDASWDYDPFGWRFFGALAGVGSVLFMYLIARRLFQSEVAGLAAAFLLTFEGLAFVQSRIATPDTYVLFFVLGAVYFLISNRFLLSGVFFGAALATKWNATFTIIPILLYLAYRLVKGLQESKRGERVEPLDIVLPGGLAMLYVGMALTAYKYLGTHPDQDYEIFGGPLQAAGAVFIVLGAMAVVYSLVFVAASKWSLTGLLSDRGRVFLDVAVVFGLFFMLVPAYIYLMTYIPMLLNGHAHGFLGLGDVLELNRRAYDFHSHCDPPGCAHGYSSSWFKWPVMVRPIYLYVQDWAKIYSLGNPAIFWAGLPALGFVAWRGLNLRLKRGAEAGTVTVTGALRLSRWPLLFVVLSYLGFWLPWALNPRILFIYHYLPAVGFLVLALSYCVHWLWHRPEPWGRTAAIGFLTMTALTFIYFYPHLAAVNVSPELDESYYWFNSWR